ncbi:MAG: ATP-binding protein [Phycisphaerae bacterium]|jgi:MinD superfamily P-loop ATPase
MKEIVVISGKGGTGKTSIAGCFAAMAKDAVLADCDVDAADLHLILQPTVIEEHEFCGGKKARIVTDRCIGCGRCADVCKFAAVKENVNEKKFVIDEIGCEGCGVCRYFCPAGAIEFEDAINGKWYMSETRFGTMLHAELGAGEENSGKLVSLLRKEAKARAKEQKKELIIVDGSPGIGCPVIASLAGADFAVIVTEPTMSGLHDLSRVAELTKQLGVAAGVCINKYDINKGKTAEIEKAALEKGLAALGRIEYDKAVTESQIDGVSIVEYTNNALAGQITEVWRKVLDTVGATQRKDVNDNT